MRPTDAIETHAHTHKQNEQNGRRDKRQRKSVTKVKRPKKPHSPACYYIDNVYNGVTAYAAILLLII